MDGEEIELKLALSPDALNRLRRLPVLRRHRQGRPARKRLHSLYYDTPDQQLAKAGVTVRVRHDGKGKILQTVKTAGSRTSGLFSRQEWETEITAPTPTSSACAPPAWTSLPAIRCASALCRSSPPRSVDPFI